MRHILQLLSVLGLWLIWGKTHLALALFSWIDGQGNPGVKVPWQSSVLERGCFLGSSFPGEVGMAAPYLRCGREASASRGEEWLKLPAGVIDKL